MSTKSKKTETTRDDLTTRAMLATLNISTWSARKKDKDVQRDVTDENKAQRDAGAWWTRIIPPKALSGIGAAEDQARTYHNLHTRPWHDGGCRILPAVTFMEYTKAMREARVKFEEAVELFLSEYPTLVSQAAERLGDLYKPDQYPTVSELRGKFGFNISISPLPSAADFRVDLGAEHVAEIRRQIEADAKATFADSMRSLWERLHGAVQKLADRLGDSEARLHASLISNLAEVCDLLPALNIEGDQTLEAMRQDVVKRLCSQDIEQLREDEAARGQAATTAKAIADRVAQYLG